MAFDLAKMLDCGSFRLNNFISNCKLQRVFYPRYLLKFVRKLNHDPNKFPSERALVVRWFVETDEPGFKIGDLKRPGTKRGTLSSICSLFDLVGFAAPETMTTNTRHLEDMVGLGSALGRGLTRQLQVLGQSAAIPDSTSHNTLLLPPVVRKDGRTDGRTVT